jgi:hypothetical protein
MSQYEGLDGRKTESFSIYFGTCLRPSSHRRKQLQKSRESLLTLSSPDIN